MANLQLQKELESLKKLGEFYENQLRVVGFELCDLPDDVSALLDECVELQRATNLHSLQSNYLKEFYFTKMKEQIDNKLTIAKMQAEIKEQEAELEKITAECAELEKFMTTANKRAISATEMQRNKIMLEKQMQALQHRQNLLNIPEDLNIEELIKKVDLLKTNDSKPK